MKILIAGFYGHGNFGDDCFMSVYNSFFAEHHEIKYTDIATLDKERLDDYDAIVVGGGDVLNDFYGLKYNEVLAGFGGYKIAAGVGISFLECTKRSYLNVFDDIVLRSKTDLKPLNKILGSLNTHYLPDLAFSIPLTLNPPPNERIENKNIGFYLVGTMMENPGLMYTIHRFTHWVLTQGYHVHLIPMQYEDNFKNTDIVINNNIAKVFSMYSNQITVHPLYGFNEFINITNTMNLALCVRFHAHVFCTRLGVPFISIPLTRKVELYTNELPDGCHYCPLVIKDDKYNLLGIDIRDIKNKFNDLVANKSTIRDALLFRSIIDYNAFGDNKIVNLVNNHKKRICQPINNIIVNPEDIYTKYRDAFLIRGVNPATDKCTDILPDQVINRLADALCYDITKDTANDYSYGTRINIRSNLHKLRDIVYYIYQDFMDKQRVPRININYIKQDSFHDLHRAGWQYSIIPLYGYSGDHGVLFDTYLDRTFGWASDLLVDNGVLPYTNHWVGFFHHTFESEFSANSCSVVFDKPIFRSSLILCKGIYCLTRYLANLIKDKLTEIGFGSIPVNALHHPTIFVNNNFDYQAFLDNPARKLINVGSWYRNPVTLYRLANKYTSDLVSFNMLKGKRMDANFCPDKVEVTMVNGQLSCKTNIWTQYFIKYINEQTDTYSRGLYSTIIEALKSNPSIDIRNMLDDFLSKVTVLDTLSNEEFDNMYVNNIVFLDLVDSSTVNTILEVIVRKTPLVVNRIPPTVELLGENYPMFYDKIEDIPNLLTAEKILEAHQYMINSIDDSVYRIDSFVESLLNSEIYKSLV
jgi:hypothetical protein